MKIEFGTGSAFARLSEEKAYFLVNYALDLGIKIKLVKISSTTAVDVHEDIKKVERILKLK